MSRNRYAPFAMLAVAVSLFAAPLTAQQDAETANRIQYASLIEQQFLANGVDMHVATSGASLTFRYTLMGRPLVYQLTHNQDMLLQWRVMRFVTVWFIGSNETWRFLPETGETTYEKR